MRTGLIILAAFGIAGAFLALAVGPALLRAWPALMAIHQGVR